MYNSVKFGNISVKYQADMYMIETGNSYNIMNIRRVNRY